ncbi:hypothetical protein Pla175_27560 [Pirellulimonas nuda]|uniref:Uncharacterized protein n=1 Tax=Pirellulimonas nuda TaxID=2528009 RepID=A0A518DD08_9BACT|nr:hypothetical protein [Pirellulimonas nuda]QDU89367.1 hypothetical protein Pla175_27560 [Pirellulimonas nuda]
MDRKTAKTSREQGAAPPPPNPPIKRVLEDIRRVRVDLESADYLRETLGLPGFRIALRVRGHGRIEHGLHFLQDRWWGKDRPPPRRPGLSARRWARHWAIVNAAISIHLLLSNPDLPVRAAADHIAWSPVRRLQLLNS